MMNRTSELVGADVENVAEFGPPPLPFHHWFCSLLFTCITTLSFLNCDIGRLAALGSNALTLGLSPDQCTS